MTKPQQPELARSGRGEVDPGAVKTRRGGPTDSTPPTGPIPEDNLPGHHPEHEQDKPVGPPPRARARRAAAVEGQAQATITDLSSNRQPVNERFTFAFEPRISPLSYALGVMPFTAHAHVRDGQFHVHFGPWRMCTSLDNIEGAEVTGPYSWWKVAGPPRLSLKDRGITLATSTKQGVCIRFREPVPALLPGGVLRHPALTVTVDDPERLVEVLTER